MLQSQADILNQLLVSRTTVHEYTSKPLPADALGRALEAAVAAPNHRLTEPWRFLQVGPDTRKVLAELQVRLKAKGRALQPEVLERTLSKMLTPPELLVACRVRHANPEIEREDYAAVSCAIHSVCLSLWAEGVGSKWGTGAVTTLPETYRALGVDIEDTEIVGFLWLGFPASPDMLRKPERRLKVGDVLRRLP